MNPNIDPSNRVTLAGVINPDLNAAGTITTGWVSLATFGAILAVISWGALGTSATIDAKLEQASDSGGTGAKDITGKAITQVDGTASPVPNDGEALINCRADELDVANEFTHVRLSMTVATASSDSAGYIFGLDAREQPASHAATVAEVIE